jgi:HNH endonuclease
MARAFTQYWRSSEPNWHHDGPQTLPHAGSDQFKARGVRPGDKVFIVTIIDDKVHLGGVILVDRIIGLRETQRIFGREVIGTQDHILARDPQPFFPDLRIPMRTVRALRFLGNKPLVFVEPGKLDTQTLRGVRELTDESAAMLQDILDSRELPKPEQALPSPWPLPDMGRLFGEELVLGLEVLQREDLSETEKQAIIKARRGQGIFRDNVLKVEPRCRVTRVDDPAYLVASHIRPWAESSNGDRLSENNGLMLAPHVDHLFDKGLIGFTDSGDLLLSSSCSAAVLGAWGISPTLNVGPFRGGQRPFLAYHRQKYGFKN